MESSLFSICGLDHSSVQSDGFLTLSSIMQPWILLIPSSPRISDIRFFATDSFTTFKCPWPKCSFSLMGHGTRDMIHASHDMFRFSSH
jgi:hypothetical protein